MKTSERVAKPGEGITRWFGRYAQRRLRRDFHALRLLGEEPAAFEGPLVVYANHSSWWDPLVALAVRPLLFPERQAYTPIDAAMLEKYGIFKRLGFFEVDRSSRRGIARYLAAVEEVLGRPGAMLYVTPQGRFADVRERPLGFQRGIGYVAERVPGVGFLPMAIEYAFWEESKLEILLHFGELRVFPDAVGRDEACEELERCLGAAQDRVAAASIGRAEEEFRIVLKGGAGVGGVYDLWRRVRAWSRGRAPELSHGER